MNCFDGSINPRNVIHIYISPPFTLKGYSYPLHLSSRIHLHFSLLIFHCIRSQIFCNTIYGHRETAMNSANIPRSRMITDWVHKLDWTTEWYANDGLALQTISLYSRPPANVVKLMCEYISAFEERLLSVDCLHRCLYLQYSNVWVIDWQISFTIQPFTSNYHICTHM